MDSRSTSEPDCGLSGLEKCGTTGIHQFQPVPRKEVMRSKDQSSRVKKEASSGYDCQWYS